MNYFNRSVGFGLLALVLGAYLLESGHPMTLQWWWLWLGVAVHGFVVPAAMYARGRHHSRPLEAEIQHMYLDGALFGLWIGGLGFPLWVSFTMAIGAALNLMSFRGPWGLVRLLVLGTATTWTTWWWIGHPWHLETGPWTTGLAMGTLSLYLLLFARSAHQRTLALQRMKDRLSLNEAALTRANHTLQQQLDEIRALQGQLKDQAHRDALTGLFNRHYLGPTLELELARCLRGPSPLSVWLVDVDHFKQINDTHGHTTGDAVLQVVAQKLQAQARKGDVACRYGGEEFLLLLPNTPLNTAAQRADEWRALLARMPWPDHLPADLRLTVSIGVACAPEQGQSADALLQAADRALYQAKTGGRNQVVACKFFQ